MLNSTQSKSGSLPLERTSPMPCLGGVKVIHGYREPGHLGLGWYESHTWTQGTWTLGDHGKSEKVLCKKCELPILDPLCPQQFRLYEKTNIKQTFLILSCTLALSIKFMFILVIIAVLNIKFYLTFSMSYTTSQYLSLIKMLLSFITKISLYNKGQD